MWIEVGGQYSAEMVVCQWYASGIVCFVEGPYVGNTTVHRHLGV